LNQLEGGVKAVGTVAHVNEKNQRIELIIEDRRIMKIISKQLKEGSPVTEFLFLLREGKNIQDESKN
jgi:hypothetical protein